MAKKKKAKTRIVQIVEQPKDEIIEYGVLYPDGVIEWEWGDSVTDYSFRKKKQDEYERKATAFHLTAGVLEFVVRKRITTYTKPRVSSLGRRSVNESNDYA